MPRMITRLYDTFFDAQHAVIELERIGVPHRDISLVSNKSDKNHSHVLVREARDRTSGETAAADAGVGAAAGGALGAAGGVLAGLGMLAIPGVGPVVAAGWLAAAAAGAVVGAAVVGAAGGIVGALTNGGVSEAEAHVYAEGVRRGGTLVSARIADDKLVDAEAALARVPSVDLNARSAAYRERGWSRFDDRGAPYTEREVVSDPERTPPAAL